jgi:hypothetical protein
LRKPTNQLVISPAPIYISSDISASDFPEVDIIRRCIGGLDTGGGTMYSQISIEGYHLLLNIHTEITIGQIDIRDADLNIGGWLIWCPANWKEVATKYEAHIKEQIYKDENMKALLGLSSIGTIISVIESITSWAMRIRQK